MGMTTRAFGGLALAISLACSAAQAQENPLEAAGQACVYGSGQGAIDACTALINVNNMPEMADGRAGRLQALYLTRFQHYHAQGNLTAACADVRSAVAQGLPLQNIDEAKVLAFKSDCDAKGY